MIPPWLRYFHILQAQASATATSDPAKFKGKKSKAAAKSGTASYQWQILEMSGIPESEIEKFRYRTSAGMTQLQHASSFILWKQFLLPGDCRKH